MSKRSRQLHYARQRLRLAWRRHDPENANKWTVRIQKLKSAMRKAAKRKPARQRIVIAAELCKHNYEKNPRAYHYLAGGKANTVIDRPTPPSWRSDCSQFAVNVYRMAGVKCPGTGSYLFSNTDSIAEGGKIVASPKPGDLGMYGSGRRSTHHVEVYIGNGKFIGHGSPPIDSLTPGKPDFYLSFLP